jgi:multicomponent Na+:H+ antiporter subunit B
MPSLLLQTAARYLLPLLLLFSFFLLLRGHHEPGGGFVGGLVAAAAFTIYAIAFDVPTTRRALGIELHTLVGLGLFVAAGSGLLGLLQQTPFMSGVWLQQALPVLGKVGTPVIFDAGVYLVVIGVTLLILFSLMETANGSATGGSNIVAQPQEMQEG